MRVVIPHQTPVRPHPPIEETIRTTLDRLVAATAELEGCYERWEMLESE